MTPENYNSHPDSEYQALLQSNVTFLENNGFQSVYRMMRFIGNASFSLLALLFYDWRLFVLSILLSALLLFVPRILSKYTKKGGKLISSGNSQLMNRVSEAIKGHQNLAALSAYSYFCSLIDKGSESLKEASVKNAKIQGQVGMVTAFLNIVSQLILIGATGLLVFAGKIAIGSIVAVLELSAKIFDSLGIVSRFLVAVNSTIPISQKIAEISSKSVTNNNKNTNTFHDLKFEDVGFKYQGSNDYVFRHLNFTVKKGDFIQVFGKSGIGKTTLFKVITGELTPTEGKIYYNNISTENITYLDRSNLVQMVPQDGYIFNDSVEGNISLGRDVKRNLIDNLINELEIPKGDPAHFSGGEKQRIGLARALVSQDKLTLIDEGLSQIDIESARKLLSVINKYNKYAIIFISHRDDELKDVPHEIINLEELV